MVLGLRRDIATAWRRGPFGWRDIAIACWELALANVAFRRAAPADLLLRATGSDLNADKALTARQQAFLARVAYAVSIMGLRVPWRSDCVVQAIAARHWLGRRRITSVICIGVRNDERGFQAHAWLKVGEQIVTGGDISSYAELPSTQAGRALFAE